MKKIIATLVAASLFVAGTFAEGYINANDLDKGSVTTSRNEEDGFVLVGTAEKPLEVQSCETKKAGGDVFTQRISTKGSGSTSFRNVSFPVKAGEKVTVYALSSSKSAARPLHLVNVDTGEEVKTISANADGSDMTVDTTKISVAGTYCVYSTSGTAYIYQIQVTK